MLGNFLTPHATKRLVSEFCVRNYVVQTTKRRLTTRRGQSQADRATAARVGPSGQEHYKLHAIDERATTRRVGKTKHYFAFADAAFSRAPATMPCNFPCSASTLNKSTTKGT